VPSFAAVPFRRLSVCLCVCARSQEERPSTSRTCAAARRNLASSTSHRPPPTTLQGRREREGAAFFHLYICLPPAPIDERPASSGFRQPDGPRRAWTFASWAPSCSGGGGRRELEWGRRARTVRMQSGGGAPSDVPPRSGKLPSNVGVAVSGTTTLVRCRAALTWIGPARRHRQPVHGGRCTRAGAPPPPPPPATRQILLCSARRKFVRLGPAAAAPVGSTHTHTHAHWLAGRPTGAPPTTRREPSAQPLQGPAGVGKRAGPADKTSCRPPNRLHSHFPAAGRGRPERANV
jgi:hypothetical protein